MKLQELIEQLHKLQEQYGSDIEVKLEQYSEMGNYYQHTNEAKYDEIEKSIVIDYSL